MNVLYSPRETRSSGCVSLEAGDHVADVDNKELGLPTAERNGDVPRRETEREQVVTIHPHCRPHDRRPCDRSHTLCSCLDAIMEIQQASGSCWQSLDKEAVVRQIGSLCRQPVC